MAVYTYLAYIGFSLAFERSYNHSF